MTATAAPELTPGAMLVHLSRTLPSGGTIEFESAPAGWLTKAGTPRRKDWRRYLWLPPDLKPGDKGEQVPSVTTICSAVLPKDGLPIWAEARGIEGAIEAVRRGLLGPRDTDEEAIRIVRGNGLGADRARDDAADRGLNVHHILETFMHTGAAPNPAEHPESHRPFIRGLVKWLLWADPEPVAVEVLVADPDRGYAGRADLIARIHGRVTVVDLKTNPTGAIFDSAHLQIELLRQAEERHGEHEIEDELLVAVDGSGGFREMECVAGVELAARALSFYQEVRDLCSKCDDANKIQRAAMNAPKRPARARPADPTPTEE